MSQNVMIQLQIRHGIVFFSKFEHFKCNLFKIITMMLARQTNGECSKSIEIEVIFIKTEMNNK